MRGQEIELPEGEATIGRSRASTVAVVDTSISRVHARLHLRFGRATVEDLGSSNGTYVNGIRLLALAEIADGDRITVGETDLWIKVRAAGQEQEAEEEPPSNLATRRIDPRRYLCPRCGRPFAEDGAQCAACGEPRPVLPSIGSDAPAKPETGPLGPFVPLAPDAAAPDATRIAGRSRWFRKSR